MPTPPPAAAATAASNVRPAPADDVFYPCSDGKPMADNMWQANAIMNAHRRPPGGAPDSAGAATFTGSPSVNGS